MGLNQYPGPINLPILNNTNTSLLTRWSRKLRRLDGVRRSHRLQLWSHADPVLREGWRVVADGAHSRDEFELAWDLACWIHFPRLPFGYWWHASSTYRWNQLLPSLLELSLFRQLSRHKTLQDREVEKVGEARQVVLQPIKLHDANNYVQSKRVHTVKHTQVPSM